MKNIWFTQRVMVKDDYGERWNAADQKIGEFIRWCGYLPLAVPNDIELVKEMYVQIPPGGIVLTGGNSLTKYGGDAPERDMMEQWLITCAIKNEIPLLGFCRGMQSILDYFGCPLVDIKGHVAVRHNLYGKLFGRDVNSFHEQGGLVKDLSQLPIRIDAYTEDGIAEAVMFNNKKMMGIMWHPERERPFQEEDRKLFQNLFD